MEVFAVQFVLDTCRQLMDSFHFLVLLQIHLMSLPHVFVLVTLMNTDPVNWLLHGINFVKAHTQYSELWAQKS